MTIRDLIEQFEIQGKFIVKKWSDKYETYTTLVEGDDFEYEKHKIKNKYLDAEITYMYAAGNTLNIEVRMY